MVRRELARLQRLGQSRLDPANGDAWKARRRAADTVTPKRLATEHAELMRGDAASWGNAPVSRAAELVYMQVADDGRGHAAARATWRSDASTLREGQSAELTKQDGRSRTVPARAWQHSRRAELWIVS